MNSSLDILKFNLEEILSGNLECIQREPGFRLISKKNFPVENTQFIFPVDQNPLSVEYLFTKNCKHASNCSGPCCFLHDNSHRIKDIISLVKFKHEMFKCLMTRLLQNRIAPITFTESDLDSLGDNLLLIEQGKLPKLKKYIMKMVYEKKLFSEILVSQTKSTLDLERDMTFSLNNNEINPLEALFILLLCYVPEWIENQVDLIFMLNGFNSQKDT